MTFAPAQEDTDYLASDPLADSDFDDIDEFEDLSADLPADISADISEDSIDDFSEAVIDEPDLSSEIHDNPLEEPSLEDISISLDMSDLDSTGFETEEEISEEFIDEENEISIPVSEDEEADGLELADLSLIPEGFSAEEAEFASEEFGTEESLAMPEEIEEELDVLEEDEAMPEVLPEALPEEALPEEALPEMALEEMAELSSDELDSIEEVEEFIEEDGIPVVSEEPVPAASSDLDLKEDSGIPSHLKQELKTVLSYMDQLLEALPDNKIEEFAKSEHFKTYKKLFKELGLVV
jgi:hypothetical protein